MGVKQCKGCHETKPLSDFHANREMKDGRLSWCRPCFLARHREAVRKRAAKVRAYVAAIKLERGCTDCGYREHSAALDFDHLPGFVKEYEIGKLATGGQLAKLEAEIAKCEVVCANCHRVRTANRRKASDDASLSLVRPTAVA